jgi:Flp pilus assembly protein protease CpaA
MIELIPVLLALGAACIATYTDLKKGRIIPNWLTLPLIPIGIAFYIIWGAYQRYLLLAISGAVGSSIAFGVGYALWLTGGWAGGDVKLFTAFGALVPMFSSYYARAPYSSNYPLFSITILFNSVIVMLPVIIVYAIACRAQGRGAFYEQVKISELKEYMALAEVIYVKDGKIGRWRPFLGLSFLGFGKPSWDRAYTNPNRAAGLTRYQVSKLKQLMKTGKLKGSIKIKKVMPYAPALCLGLFIAVFYGDLYWRLVTLITGVSAQLLIPIF